MTTVTKYNATNPFEDLFDWMESGWPATAEWRREGARAIKVEDQVEKDRYVVRAELPGIDPAKDVDVSVAHGMLTMRAERREETKDTSHSEFRYGSFVRRVALPDGADEDKVSASYKDGILEIVVPLSAPIEQTRTIPIERRDA